MKLLRTCSIDCSLNLKISRPQEWVVWAPSEVCNRLSFHWILWALICLKDCVEIVFMLTTSESIHDNKLHLKSLHSEINDTIFDECILRSNPTWTEEMRRILNPNYDPLKFVPLISFVRAELETPSYSMVISTFLRSKFLYIFATFLNTPFEGISVFYSLFCIHLSTPQTLRSLISTMVVTRTWR